MGKGKKDDDKNKKKEEIAQVDRTFYELTITDLNNKLARLRSQLATLDENNFAMKEELKNITELRNDVAAHLDKALSEANQRIGELEERLSATVKERNAEKIESNEKIKDLTAKYKAMHDQLSTEIKLLNGKLNSLDEFRVQRDHLMLRFDEQEADAKEKERIQQEMLFNMEQQRVVERDALKKEVELKLLRVSEDFTRSSEIRNAGYTRRLIRENIALQKEIENLVLSQIKIQKDFEDNVQKNKEMCEEYNALDQLKTELIRSSQNKIKIIEKLTDNYENLKTKFVELLKYKTLYENLTKQDACERFTLNDTTRKLKELSKRIQGLKLDRNRLIASQEAKDFEIARLKGLLRQVKTTVEVAITSIQEEKKESALLVPIDEKSEEKTAFRKLRRKDLVTELLDILSNEMDTDQSKMPLGTPSQSKSSLYRPGKMGFLQRSRSGLIEIFKFGPQDVRGESVPKGYQIKRESDMIIPRCRAGEAGSIIDVSKGSTLYVSESHEEIEIPRDDEQPEDMGEEGSSSEFDEVPDKPKEVEAAQVEEITAVVSYIETEADEEGEALGEMTSDAITSAQEEEDEWLNLFY